MEAAEPELRRPAAKLTEIWVRKTIRIKIRLGYLLLGNIRQ